MPVKHQRKRHNTDAQGHDREQKTDAATNDDERPSFRRRQHARCEVRDARSRSVAEDCDVDGVRYADPGPEQNEQEHAEFDHGAESRSAQHVKRIRHADLLAALAAAAELVETNRGKGSKQGKPGCQRKQQRQYRIAKDHPEQSNTENGINHAHDDRVTWHCLEVFPAQAQRLAPGRIVRFCEWDMWRRRRIRAVQPLRCCRNTWWPWTHPPVLKAAAAKRRAFQPRVSALMCGKRDRAEYGKPKFNERSLAGRNLSRPAQ